MNYIDINTMDWESFNNYLWLSGDVQYLWIVMTLMAFYMALKLKMLSNDPDLLNSTKKLYNGYSVFFILYGITRVLFLFTDYFNEINDNDNSNLEFVIITKVAYLFALFGLIYYMYQLEAYFINTKGLIFKTILVLVALTIFLPYEIYSVVVYFLLPIAFLFIFSLYLKILKNAKKGELKKMLRKTTVYLYLMALGIGLDVRLVRDFSTIYGIRWLSYQLPPILVIFSMWGLSKNVPFIDPSKWLFHLWIIDNKSSVCLFEIGFKELNIDHGILTSFLSAVKTFGKQISQSELRGLIFTDYTYLYRKYAQFSIVVASHIETMVTEIEYFTDDLAINFEETFKIQIEHFDGNTGQFEIYALEIQNQLRKAPLNIRLLDENQKIAYFT